MQVIYWAGKRPEIMVADQMPEKKSKEPVGSKLSQLNSTKYTFLNNIFKLRAVFAESKQKIVWLSLDVCFLSVL